MTPKYPIIIVAKDKATGVFGRIGASAAKLLKPIADANRSFRKIAAPELGRVAKGLDKVRGSAVSVAQGLATVVPPLEVLTGFASVAGLAALSYEFMKLGVVVGRASDLTGVSAASLQRWQGAAKLLGFSSEEATQSLNSLGNTMEDALYGRNQEALGLLNRLGVVIHKNADGTVNAADGMGQLAEAIKRANPQVQQLIARQFGLEKMLPLLRRGSDGIKQLQQRYDELGYSLGPASIAKAERFQESIGGLEIAVGGLGSRIGEALIPVLEPTIDSMAKWVAANREWIASGITTGIKEFRDYLKSIDWKDIGNELKIIGDEANSVVQTLGGWEHMLNQIYKVSALLFRLTPFGWLSDLNHGKNPSVELAGAAAGVFGNPSDLLGEFKSWLQTTFGDKDGGPYLPLLAAAKPGGRPGQIPIGSPIPGSGLLSLVRRLEGSADDAISPAGAIGRYQIMPGTAQQYGFDPGKLKDPRYNEMVASSVIGDLQRKYKNDQDAVLIGYNAGPGRADRFLADGRNYSSLPGETQRYLMKAYAMNPGGELGGGQNGQVDVKVTLQNAPAGTRIETSTKGPVAASSRVVSSMPALALP